MRVTGLELVVMAAVLAGAGGTALAVTVKRRAPSSAEASRRSQLFSACTSLLLAVVLAIRCVVIQDAARYFLIPLAVVMAVNGLVVLRKNRKAPVPPS
jgi:hypothetical protein